MKRMLLAAIAAGLFFSSVIPGMAQGGYGRGGLGWNQSGPRGMRGQGLRNGTGPRALNGTCPRFTANVQAPTPNVSAPPGRGWGNGMGPRALNGTCPLLAPQTSAPAPSTTVAK